VEQTSITDAEMHAKGYLSDIIPVSTAERDPAFPFLIGFHYLDGGYRYTFTGYGWGGYSRALEVFPLETARDEHFQVPRERP
jgi:hypothetical protein